MSREILERIHQEPREEDIVYLLSRDSEEERQELFSFADSVRKRYMGDGVLLRGIVEFSNLCENSCAYCGLNKNNRSLQRYTLSADEVIESVRHINSCGIKTVVLQSGEDSSLDPAWLEGIIRRVRGIGDIAVTLSVGERRPEDYRLWRDAGADRYLLKIETSDPDLYGRLHPGMSFRNRLRCLDDLRELGYQVGCGNIVGLKGQTAQIFARDILFFKNSGFDMIGIGPFIPHGSTGLLHEPSGDVGLTLRVLALTRIVTRTAHLPATTALGSLGGDFRARGLQAGANVLMPNFTPQPYRKLYEIYPGKRCIDEAAGACSSCMEGMAAGIGRYIDYSRGDAVNPKS